MGDLKQMTTHLVDECPTVEQGGCAADGGGGMVEASPSSSSSPAITFPQRKARKLLNSSGQKRENRKAKADAIIVPPLKTLSEEGAIALAIQHLKACDPLLGRLIDVHHPPIFHKQHTPFHSLSRSILYQQLAIKAASSIYSRFIALCGGENGVVPETVLRLSPLQLRQIGVSSRKAVYLHDLAAKFSGGLLSDAAILEMDDQSLVSMLTMVKGIGLWSVYMDRWSVDTWVYPNLFRMNTSTGAPPHYFDKNGQNWGFPTYNWEEMSKDNYAWWCSRLSQMGKYFTAYRIDHILGFFRIWELPEHAITGLLGKFRPSIPLSQEELEKEGIWDFNRLTHPYIRKDMLEGKFGRLWTVIASTFLNEYQKLCYE